MSGTPYGFWIAGPPTEPRRLVDAARAFAGFAACDERASIDGEHYLSAFDFGPDFLALAEPGWGIVPVRGFAGVCGASRIWWDIDRPENLDAAMADARALCLHLADQHAVEQADILIFYSGCKGFHIGIPVALWEPMPSPNFTRVARRFAESIAAAAGGIIIDAAIYDRVRAFRAPNSRHPKTGLCKRRLTVDELLGLTLERIIALAAKPEPFEVPTPTGRNNRLAAAWAESEQAVATAESAVRERRDAQAGVGGSASLNRATLHFLRDGAPVGDRHRAVFAAAANLAEHGCPPALAHALLTEAALDTGLPPSEVRRQIECGLAHGECGSSPHSGASSPLDGEA